MANAQSTNGAHGWPLGSVSGSQTKALIEASGVSPETLGARIQRLRLRQDLTVRDLADLAAVDKNTILRVERGFPTSRATLVLIAAALRLDIARLLVPIDGEEAVRVHKHGKDHWRRHGLMNAGGAVREGEGVIESERERRSAALDGESVFFNLLDCQLDNGQMVSSILEIYGDSQTRTHPGEEFVYCLKGKANITVGGREILLETGEAASFWSSEPHIYSASCENIANDDLPVRVLSVRLDARPKS